MSRDSLGKTLHIVLSELEETINTHIKALRALKIACIKLKKGEHVEKHLESRIKAIKRIRNEIMKSLKSFEESKEPVDEELASEIVAMVVYIEMSAIKDEKRYLLIAKKLLEKTGSRLDIEEDLIDLEEISRSAKKIIEKYTNFNSIVDHP
ncbi:MAG: hypothetical protein RQ885_02745 [Desulfurococcales archaeon]|jgi:hypothetical protein|nr:hypothetical protein [Desulfurococcales archaeon]